VTDEEKFMERNREIIAERLGWPEGALEAVRKLETDHEGYVAYWSTWGSEGEGFYGLRQSDRLIPRPIVHYGKTPDDLSSVLAKDAGRYPPVWW
jgi:hypothetical protein